MAACSRSPKSPELKSCCKKYRSIRRDKNNCPVWRGKEIARANDAHKALYKISHLEGTCVVTLYFIKKNIYHTVRFTLWGGGGGEVHSSMKKNMRIHPCNHRGGRRQKSSISQKINSANNSPKLTLANKGHNE